MKTAKNTIALVLLTALIGCQNPTNPATPAVDPPPAPGSLDTTFGAGGIVTTPNMAGLGTAIQADGKIVVAGTNDSNADFTLVRYETDGTLDASFGINGIVTTAIGSGLDIGYDVAIQVDGKIVVAGFSDNGSNSDFALVRHKTDGTLDASFGTGGIVTTAIGSGSEHGYAVAIQADGKIVVAGFSENGSNTGFALVRYGTDGTLDASFGSGGIVTTAIGSGSDRGYDVAIQSDGKIVVAGYSESGSNSDFALVRYGTDGTLDASFGTGGIVTTAIGSNNDYGSSVAIQEDGKIVVAGFSNNASNDDFALVRYGTDGTLDASFGTDGKVRTVITSDDWGTAVAIQTDGKIIVAGSSFSGLSTTFAITRYKTDGTMDTSFGWGGIVTTAIGSMQDMVDSLAIQADGKIVVTGYCNNGSNNIATIVRYWP